MEGYWWECQQCHLQQQTTRDALAAYLWQLAESAWDQRQLVRECSCGGDGRITYEFPGSGETFAAVHIVGLTRKEGYLPMMWETIRSTEPEKRNFDFKYAIKGRNAGWGLNRPAIFERHELRELFALYREKVGGDPFP